MRSESVPSSSEAAKMQINLQNVNNMGGGCMGMCSERTAYKLEI